MPDSFPPTTEEPDATLRPPQFSLRAMLIGTTLAAALIAVMLSVGGGWALCILLFTTLIAAHVIGNSVGTRLRDSAPVRRAQSSARVVAPAGAGSRRAAFPTSRLYEQRRLHWISLVFTALGLGTGSYFGGHVLADSYPEATTAAHTLAYVSSGVLGALAAFIVSSFLLVIRQALSDAHAGSDRPTPRRVDTPPGR